MPGPSTGASGVVWRPPLGARGGLSVSADGSGVLDPAELTVLERLPGAEPEASASGNERSDRGQRRWGAATALERQPALGAEQAAGTAVVIAIGIMCKPMNLFFRRLWTNEDGAEIVEWVIVAAVLIGVAGSGRGVKRP